MNTVPGWCKHGINVDDETTLLYQERKPIDDDDLNNIAKVLGRLILADDGAGVKSRFDSVSAPQMSLPVYIRRLFHGSDTSGPSFVVAVIYIHRFLAINPRARLNITNAHRLLVTTVALAAKVLDDGPVDTHRLAKLGGVSVREQAELELLFLKFIRWSAHVSHEEYYETLAAVRTCAQKPGLTQRFVLAGMRPLTHFAQSASMFATEKHSCGLGIRGLLASSALGLCFAVTMTAYLNQRT